MIKKIIYQSVFFIFVALILGLSVRGVSGNPNDVTLNTQRFRDNGPLELSPERGRFALTYSLVENKSFQFSLPIARFIIPDLGYKNGSYVSIFAPAASFIVIPGYILGRFFGVSQVGTFAVISFFAVMNSLLIYAIAKKLSVNTLAAMLGSLLFLFATPAFAYAITLYQHHISTFMILLSIYTLMASSSIWPLIVVWLMYGFAVSVDYPNAILMLPIVIYSLGKIFHIAQSKNGIRIRIKIAAILASFVLVVPVMFFLWTNNSSYGNPLQLAGTVRGVKKIDDSGSPLFSEDIENIQKPEAKKEIRKKTVLGFFNTRRIINGFYVHFLSSDRGIISFTPVILMSIIGGFVAYRRRSPMFALLVSIIGANVLLYSMWGDPWGGWAFGSRYLIPSYALMSIFIAIALTKFSKNIIFILIFLLITSYSISVNTLGALTSNANPPKVEVLALEKLSGREEKYTYERNLDILMAGKSKSFVFQSFASRHVNALQYYYIVNGLVIFITGLQLILLYFSKKKEALHE